MTRDRIELDLHRLELRFADSRLVEPRALARLAESIEQCGQIVPCVVVAAPESQDGEAGGAQALVLIDGYRRVGALRRLGRDTVAPVLAPSSNGPATWRRRCRGCWRERGIVRSPASRKRCCCARWWMSTDCRCTKWRGAAVAT
jgi:hypothetical protein